MKKLSTLRHRGLALLIGSILLSFNLLCNAADVLDTNPVLAGDYPGPSVIRVE